MEKIINKTWWGRVDEYEVVDTFPRGYEVWPIGRENFPYEGYIPLVKPDPNHEFWVLQDGKKALRCKDEGEALFIMNYASKGGYPRRRKSDGITKEVFNQLIKEYYGK